MLLHFGTQSEHADFSEHGVGNGFPDLPKLNARMEKVNAHKEAKEAKEGKDHHHDDHTHHKERESAEHKDAHDRHSPRHEHK